MGLGVRDCFVSNLGLTLIYWVPIVRSLNLLP